MIKSAFGKDWHRNTYKLVWRERGILAASTPYQHRINTLTIPYQAWSRPRWTGNLPLFSKHVLHYSERALVASQITPTSAPALDSSSMSRAARGSAVGGHERRCSTLRLLRRCSRPPRCHHLAASHVAAAPPLLRHAAGQRRAWLRSASRSVSSCSLDEFMSDERCSACVPKTSESVSQ